VREDVGRRWGGGEGLSGFVVGGVGMSDVGGRRDGRLDGVRGMRYKVLWVDGWFSFLSFMQNRLLRLSKKVTAKNL
jgi:hypothetical protein